MGGRGGGDIDKERVSECACVRERLGEIVGDRKGNSP